jgi:hypothetical protein
MGLRRLDNFLAIGNEAIESKMTYVVASRRIRLQIAKDAWLLGQGLLSRVSWILYGGGSFRLKALLAESGITIIDGWQQLGDLGERNRAE